MKRKQWEELKNTDAGQLEKMLHESQQQLRALQYDMQAGKIKNVKSVRELRKNVARMMTLLGQAQSAKPAK